jgi:hypothetical protein
MSRPTGSQSAFFAFRGSALRKLEFRVVGRQEGVAIVWMH